MSLLGPPRVAVQGRTVIGLNTPRVLALLAYLAVEAHRPHERSALAVLFWPDQPEKLAFRNLRQLLFRLRQALGDEEASPPHLLAGPDEIQFNRQSDYWLDVEAWSDLWAQAQRHPHRRLDACLACIARLGQAAGLYRGDFLAGLNVSGSLALDEWLLIEREGRQRRACAALHALASAHLALGQPQAACGYARRLLHMDPWDETAQRLLLRALALGEGRNAALQQYETFRRALLAELGVEPEDRTLALAASIQAGALQPGTPANRLPAPATPLVGRQAELQSLGDHLAGRERRLLTLYGPGGCGKTRLALEVAARQAPLWRDGVWFVPLVEAPSPEALVDALAAALEIQAGDRPLDAGQLLDFLRPKELLLVLDGFEHLAAGASLLEDIVRRAPEVRVLVTSRARLGLPAEWAIPLGGLTLPDREPATVAGVEDSSAVQLFVQSARRVAPTFGLTAENLPHVARICRLVEGLPLGIELAAAWVRLYHCQQIAAEIEGSPDFLQERGIARPQGQHSLRGTFDYSYSLLPESERALFRTLSVFRGGFEVDAARHVTGADPRGLDSLLDKSLLQVSSARRLDLHLTLREYAAEKLAGHPAEEAAAQARHSHFYLAFLREREGAIAGEQSKKILDEIQAEIANVRAAWRRAVAANRIAELDASLEGLSRFYDLSGYFREAEGAFGEALERLATSAGANNDAQRLACRLLVEQAGFLARRGQHAQVLQVAARAVESARAVQDVQSEARATFRWGEALWRQGDLDGAQARLERALALVRTGIDAGQRASSAVQEVETGSLNCLAAIRWMQGQRAEAESYLRQALDLTVRTGNRQAEARLLGNLGVMAVEQGKYAEARDLFVHSLTMHQASGNRRGAGIALGNLGNVFLYLGAYAEARSYYEQALDIQREIGDGQNEALSLGNVGLVYHYLGDHESARDYSQRALELALEMGERRSQGAMWLKLGHALAGLRQLDAAADAYRQSVALRREMGMPGPVMEPLAGLAWVCLARGDVGQALVHVEEIVAHLESGGAHSPGSGHALDGAISPFQVYLTCYHVLEANQDDRAPVVLATAHDLLRARAARIGDETMRRSFLENVAAHRQLVQAFARMRAAE
jgi:predicted ATPase/DNA-binding SARP family transcriptional activator